MMVKVVPNKLLWLLASLLITGAIVAVDLWSKAAVFEFLEVVSAGDPPRVNSQQHHVVIEDFFWLEANYNYGAFSGWFSEHTEYLAGVSVLAAIVLTALLIVHLRRHARPHALYVVALALLLGGTLGNLYDRAVLHAVRDWIRWFYVSSDGRHHVWPNFNIADSAICTGVGCLVLLEILRWRGGAEHAGGGAPNA